MPIKRIKRITHNIELYDFNGRKKYLARNRKKGKFFNTEAEAKNWIDLYIERRGKKRLNLKDLKNGQK